MSHKSDECNTIAALKAENAALRDRVAHFEMMYAISAARFPNHTVPSAHVEEREECKYVEESLQPINFKRHFGVPYNELWTRPSRPHFGKKADHPGTQVVAFNGSPNDPFRPSSVPIYQTATFAQPDICELGQYSYTRSGNPTRTAIETLMAKLEGGHAAFAFSSGMAALQTVMATLSAGDTIIASSDIYGGMYRLLVEISARMGIKVVFVDTWDLDAVRANISPSVKLLHIESPTNPLMRIVDIKALCDLAHDHGVKVSIDNTMMSPVRCTPIALGCDYVVHSATKFLCGHSDVMCGIVSVKDEQGAKEIAFLQNAQGNALSPFECWLLLRGVKTLAVRMEKNELNAVAVASFLIRQTHVVKRLHYAGINPKVCPDVCSISERDFEIHRAQTTGPGSVISFETGDTARSYRFVRALKIFKLSVSFGGCNSLVELPSLFSHASIPKEERTFGDDLVRLSIGIEHIDDLLADLSRAIDAAAEDEPCPPPDVSS